MAASSQASFQEAPLKSKNPVHSRILREVSNNNCKLLLRMAHPPDLIAFTSGTMTAWIQAELSIKAKAKDYKASAAFSRMAETVAVSHRPN